MDGSGSLLAFKVFGTPLVISGATLAGRRWGPAVSGWVGGLPLASGPLTFFLTVEQGAPFGAASAVSTLAGLLAVAVFAVAFGRLAGDRNWPGPLVVGVILYFAVVGVLVAVPLPSLVAFCVALIAISVAIWLLPGHGATTEARPVPAWDIPARAAVATAMVVGLVAAGATLGPRLVGLMAPFPVYTAVMASFAHALDGPASSLRVLRGVLVGAYGFACFYLVVALLVTHGIVAAFVAAMLCAITVQMASIWAIRRLGW